MKGGSDRTYSTLLIVGVGLMVGSGILGAMMLFAALAQGSSKSTGIPILATAGFFILLFLIGLGLVVFTLAVGLRKASGSSKTITRYENTKVIARYAINSTGETLFDESYILPDDPNVKLYVRLEVPGLGSSEYRCNMPVWGQCGEGQRGAAMIQGSWIGQFLAYPPGQAGPYGR